MVSNRIAVGALSLACVIAAGAGGYLATRHSVTPVAAPAAAGLLEPAAPAGASAPEAAVASSQPTPLREPPGPQVEAVAGSTIPIADPPAGPPAKQPKTVETKARATLPQAQGRSEQHRSAVDRNPSAAAADRDRPGLPTLSAAKERTPEPTASVQSPAATANADAQPLAARVEPLQAETPRELEPAKRSATVEELVVPADSVIGLQLDTSLNSEQARVEDRVDARVIRDVRIGGSVAVAAGSRAVGTVVVVERGGRFKERARLGIRFHTLMLADGSSLPISTDTIYRLGEGPGNGTAARIGGGAVVGAIIGGIIGGGKGAAIGATTGAGAGTASVMTNDRNVASFPAGAEVTARILSPVAVTVERQ